MGRQAFPIIGGIIGAVVVGFLSDGTATAQGYEAGFALGAAIGGVAGSYIDPLVIQGNTIGDTNIQVAAEGGARAIMYGRACITATCVVARGNRQVVKKKQSNGKGSSGSTANEYVYWTFAIGLGEALPNASICRIWQDNNLVYDVLGSGSITPEDNSKFAAKFKFYSGSEDQLPDPDLQVFLGEDTPYFRGTSYVVFPQFDLTNTAERIPQFKFEVLQGVAGVVDELEILGWSIANPGVHSSSQSVTLTGSSDTILHVDMFLSGDMEVRGYNDPALNVVGGLGRFITAPSDSAGSSWTVFNIYKIEISDPPQTFYVNNALAGESPGDRMLPDGTDAYKLSLSIGGAATITFSASDVEGHSAYYPQYGNIRAEITGISSVGDETIPLFEVANDIMLKSGMTSDQFDTSALTDLIAGACIESTSTGAVALGSIIAPYFADPTEKDAKLVWIKRGSDVLRTLTIDDLIEDPEVASRENVIEYPAKLSFFYQSPQTGYAMTKATSYRYSPQADSSGEGSVTAPVTFYSSDEPSQVAQKLHKVAWTEAEGGFTWKVGMHCIDLLPGDVIGLFLRGIATRARITAIENDGSSLTLTMLKDRQSSYTSEVTGIPLPVATPPQPTTMSKAVLAVLDIPALQDTDDSLLYYTAMSGSTSVWQGGQLQRSLDGGSSWSAIGDVTTDVTMGRLTVSMTASSSGYTDTTNTVVVQLFDSGNELVSYSDVTFLQEQGAIAIALADGTYEVLQYRDATDGGNGLWILSYLQRGRLNTVAGAHAVGALFVQLSQYIVTNSAQTAWLAGVMKHRAVSYSTSTEDADVVTNTYAGRSQLEWSPASATAQYDGTYVFVSDIVPRHRFGTEVNPIASVNFEGFRVTIADGSHTVTADITTGNAAHILSAPIVTPTSVTVAALNKITGAGAALSVVPVSVTAGSLTPTAVVNAGGPT